MTGTAARVIYVIHVYRLSDRFVSLGCSGWRWPRPICAPNARTRLRSEPSNLDCFKQSSYSRIIEIDMTGDLI